MKGHIAKKNLKKGTTYYPVTCIGYDKNKKPKYKWWNGYKTKREAQKFLNQKLAELDKVAYTEESNQKIKDYIEKWLSYKIGQIRPGTYRKYEWLINRHVIPSIGHIDMSSLDITTIRDFYLSLQQGENPLSKRSIQHCHLILKQAFKQAVKSGILGKNIFDAVDAPKPTRVEFQTWSESDVQKFLKASRTSPYYTFFALAIFTGMRMGEILALRWQDCSLTEGFLQVRRTYSYTGKGYKIEEPKTQKGNRRIAISDTVVSLLEEHKNLQIKQRDKIASIWQENDLVICTSLGTPFLQSNLRKHFKLLCKSSGVPSIRIHDLRHTHASLLLMQGTHPKIVQERLGHADIQTTLNTYSHVLPGLQEEAIKRFDKLLDVHDE